MYKLKKLEYDNSSMYLSMYECMHQCTNVYIYILYPNMYIYIRSININKGVGINYAFFSNYIYAV